MLHAVLSCSDTEILGRADLDSLNDQQLCELMIENINYIGRFQRADSLFREFGEWDGVTLTKNGEISAIRFDPFGLGGSLALEYMPS